VERRDGELSVMSPPEIAGLCAGTLSAVRREVQYRDKTERLNLLARDCEVSVKKHLDVMPKHEESRPKHEYLVSKHENLIA
jgi:hypothetical protein